MAATSQSSWPFSWIRRWHHTFVHERRTRVLAETLAAQIQHGAAVLDIGCGDGTIASHIAHLRPDVSVQGVEFQLRAGCKIECDAFDGSKLPFPGASFDVCPSWMCSITRKIPPSCFAKPLASAGRLFF